MPFNVIRSRDGQPETVYCLSAAEAADLVHKLAADGAEATRVVSTEGTELALDRLEVLARAERFGLRSRGRSAA